MSVLNNPPREMMGACRAGNIERVKELLDWGVDPRSQVDGAPLVHHAAEAGQHVAVKLLLRAGAQADRASLLLAIKAGNRYAATYLMDDLHFRGLDPFGASWASLFQTEEFVGGLTPELARWLVDNGLDTSETDSFGRSLIELARKRASAEVVEALGG